MFLSFRYPYLQFLFSRLLQKHRKYHGFGLVCGLPNILSAYVRARARAKRVRIWGLVWRACVPTKHRSTATTTTTTTTTQHQLTLSSPALPVGALALEYGQPMRNSTAPAEFRPNGWPFGLQSRCRLGTFEPAKNLESGEVLALGNPCETAQPQQNSGPMGGRLVCRADVVWAPLNPLKTWRVERYWRWATHAKQHSPSRIQAQWVAVWSAEPMSFGHL